MMHGIAMSPPSPRVSGKKESIVMAIGSVFCEPMITSAFLISTGQRSTYVAMV